MSSLFSVATATAFGGHQNRNGGYKIQRSVRLRSSASAYFNRTMAAGSAVTVYTFSAWVKRGELGTIKPIVQGYLNNNNYGHIIFKADNTIEWREFSVAVNYGQVNTNAVFRDPSAWYHIVVVRNGTSLLIYVNGVSQTLTVSTGVNAAGGYLFGASTVQRIGSDQVNSAFFDGYLTECYLIDGQALTPASFGETDPYTGVWRAKRYTGTYGTNGFYLNFSDNSAATAAAIGKDYSGLGNNWTPNNISVTAGVTYDSMLDVPTQWGDGGNGRGNYCTLNPLVTSGLSGGGILSNGNLRISGTVGVSNAYARGTMALSGKFYAEFYFDVVNATASIGVDVVTATAGALSTSSTNVSYRSGGNRRVLGTETSYGASWVANDIIGVAVDTAANTVEFFKNGVSQGVITSSAFFAQGDCVFAMSKDDIGSPTGYANFGQRPFSYTPPTGFKALNTLNLPTPTILKGNQYFDVNTWTGNASTQSIVNSGAMQPDLVWAKARSGTAGGTGHIWQDAVRGLPLYLQSNTTAAEASAADHITSFNSNGFSMGAGGSINAASTTYVGWQWKEGATQGFDIVTYTGTGATLNVSHNLGVVPSMIITKSRSATGGWPVYHVSIGATGAVQLESTGATSTTSAYWNNTAPTSTQFTLASGLSTNGVTYVAYLFSEVAGFSKFGSYTGNGSADGPFVFCGFRPRWIMWKKTNSATNAPWVIVDTSRSPYNLAREYLLPNASDAETSVDLIDVLSNGFKWRGTAPGGNASGDTYIFAAFAETSFKFSLGR